MHKCEWKERKVKERSKENDDKRRVPIRRSGDATTRALTETPALHNTKKEKTEEKAGAKRPVHGPTSCEAKRKIRRETNEASNKQREGGAGPRCTAHNNRTSIYSTSFSLTFSCHRASTSNFLGGAHVSCPASLLRKEKE